MYPLSRATRARVAITLAVVVTALSVLVPLLDQGRDPGALAFTGPDEVPGYIDHHHGVCLQHSAAAWTPAVATELPAERFVRQADSPCRAVVRRAATVVSLHHSRAPPLA